jgi:hypothetical protein
LLSLAPESADTVDLDEIWAEIQETLEIRTENFSVVVVSHGRFSGRKLDGCGIERTGTSTRATSAGRLRRNVSLGALKTARQRVEVLQVDID